MQQVASKEHGCVRRELCTLCLWTLSFLKLEAEMTKREAPGLQTQEKGVPFHEHLGVSLETGPIPCVGNTEMNRLSQGAPMMLTMGGEEEIVVSFLV